VHTSGEETYFMGNFSASEASKRLAQRLPYFLMIETHSNAIDLRFGDGALCPLMGDGGERMDFGAGLVEHGAFPCYAGGACRFVHPRLRLPYSTLRATHLLFASCSVIPYENSYFLAPNSGLMGLLANECTVSVTAPFINVPAGGLLHMLRAASALDAGVTLEQLRDCMNAFGGEMYSRSGAYVLLGEPALPAGGALTPRPAIRLVLHEGEHTATSVAAQGFRLRARLQAGISPAARVRVSLKDPESSALGFIATGEDGDPELSLFVLPADHSRDSTVSLWLDRPVRAAMRRAITWRKRLTFLRLVFDDVYATAQDASSTEAAATALNYIRELSLAVDQLSAAIRDSSARVIDWDTAVRRGTEGIERAIRDFQPLAVEALLEFVARGWEHDQWRQYAAFLGVERATQPCACGLLPNAQRYSVCSGGLRRQIIECVRCGTLADQEANLDTYLHLAVEPMIMRPGEAIRASLLGAPLDAEAPTAVGLTLYPEPGAPSRLIIQDWGFVQSTANLSIDFTIPSERTPSRSPVLLHILHDLAWHVVVGHTWIGAAGEARPVGVPRH
jgi:hypothetical protein